MNYTEWNDGIFGDEYDKTSTGNTLSEYVIGDTILRTELFREIRNAQVSTDYRDNENWGAWTVKPDEAMRPDLIAYRAYSVDTLRWVVQIAAGIDDYRDRLDDGVVLYLPTIEWLHDKLREYSQREVRL